MSDDAVRRALANLAHSADSESETVDVSGPDEQPGTYRKTIERASAAVEDLDAAAAFVEDGGLSELERAVEQAEQSVSACAEDGRRALAAFREFRDAAEGTDTSEASGDSSDEHERGDADHFHPGHGTSLGSGDIGPSE
ncbi:hypothetical protein SAMN05216559_2476 [Halomicrobium zhouii]|uniref:Uncharacterized protein n=1 Tax=Halomicrobium zhouii TaxID=767519 RepID=A0A1I6LCS4_9EURY|nr:hypothetical protein [Halomicrobium zhouii]SFS01292.1 hypothetical protein SAMN05216559_2476 [Halomicrobium zhouii]